MRIAARSSRGSGATGERLSVEEFRSRGYVMRLRTSNTLGAANTGPPAVTTPLARRNAPEEDLHRECVAWAEANIGNYPNFQWLMHVPNGGKRSRGEAGKLKAMGVKPGFPDLSIPLPHAGWLGLAVELKSATGGTTSAQDGWLQALGAAGWLVGVARTLDEFINFVNLYREGRHDSA